MKIFNVEYRNQQRLGLQVKEGEPLSLVAQGEFSGAGAMLRLVQAGISAQAIAKLPIEGQVALGEVKVLAPIERPLRNVWCVGRNYHEHAKELATTVFKENKADEKAWPIVFTKVPECVVGPFDDVRLPAKHVSEQIDYEAELAIVIGKQGKDIDAANAFEYIWGYTIVNDVTARDVQMRHKQWDMGKSFDDFCPMGPCIVTADAIPQGRTTVTGVVNGDLRQKAHTDDMIFGLAEIIETVSRGITLYPGDIIATGTPAGVGMGMTPPRYLVNGDVVRVEVDGIGFIENKFV
jgi:2-keto-4-pentenoate hydratase/2-oxohepta-3-ene-1,7-dioic acid hydratase in catechol pathway